MGRPQASIKLWMRCELLLQRNRSGPATVRIEASTTRC
jgi:hypothetical protein